MRYLNRSSIQLIKSIKMAIKQGDKFPTSSKLFYIPPEGGDPTTFNLAKFGKGKKYVVVSVPGAFTPPCTEQHLPEYISKASQFLRKGADFILVVTRNDPFVVRGWKKQLGVNNDNIIFVSDPDLDLTKKLGSTIDLSAIGLGVRSGRLAVIVGESGNVEFAAIENGGEVDVSRANKLLAKL